MVVKQAFDQVGVEPLSVELGEVKLNDELNSEQQKRLDDLLQKNGF